MYLVRDEDKVSLKPSTGFSQERLVCTNHFLLMYEMQRLRTTRHSCPLSSDAKWNGHTFPWDITPTVGGENSVVASQDPL